MSAQRLYDALMKEADRIEKIDPALYHHAAHDLRRAAADVSRAGNLLAASKRTRTAPRLAREARP